MRPKIHPWHSRESHPFAPVCAWASEAHRRVEIEENPTLGAMAQLAPLHLIGVQSIRC